MRVLGERKGGVGGGGEHMRACVGFLRGTRSKICQESLLANEIRIQLSLVFFTAAVIWVITKRIFA